jgi:hypothetical protein
MVTLRHALLAHRLGIMGAFYSHRQTVREKAVTIPAERDVFSCDLLQIKDSKRKGNLLPAMIFTAKDTNELYERLNICSLFFRDRRLGAHHLTPSFSFHNEIWLHIPLTQ